MKTKTILGIDCSSTTIGLCTLKIDENNNILYNSLDYIKPEKDGDLIERIASTRNELQAFIAKVNPDEIAVEEIVAFMKGKSTAQTIIMLTTFNRMACLLAYDHLKKAPERFNVMTIRHGIKLNKQLPAKKDIPELFAKRLNITFPYIYNTKNKIKDESYDMGDGGAVALYYALKLTDQLPKKKKEPKVKNEKASKTNKANSKRKKAK